MSSPRLSVLMTAYNSERFISRAIVSVLEQTFSDFEFIIVDDGSTDSSASIIRFFCAKDSRVRGIFLPENVGIPRAANRGLREVRAPLVARVDSDDICVSSRFAEQVSYMDKHSDIYMLGCRSASIDESGNRLKDKKYDIAFASDRKKIVELMGRGIYPLLHPTLVYRTATVRSLGGYREMFYIGEDFDLLERMFVRYGSVFANLPRVLYFYRYCSSSISSRNSLKDRCWLHALIRYSSDCVKQGHLDPLDSAKDLSLSSLPISKDEFNIIELLFYLSMYRKLLFQSPFRFRNLRRLKMIKGKLSRLPNRSEIKECLDRRFFLLLLPSVPSDKYERADFLTNFDNALSNKDGYFDSTDYCNFCLIVARGCLGLGEWRYFIHYMFRAFSIDFIFVLYFFYVRALAHLRR